MCYLPFSCNYLWKLLAISEGKWFQSKSYTIFFQCTNLDDSFLLFSVEDTNTQKIVVKNNFHLEIAIFLIHWIS